MHPVEQGAAEIVGYLALNDEDVTVDIDHTGGTEVTVLEYADPEHPVITKRARLPQSDGAAAMSDDHDRQRDNPG